VTGDAITDPRDDPDFISQDGADPSGPIGPASSQVGRWGLGSPTPVFVPKTSTPFEEEDDADGPIPPPALWAMKYRRHGHLLNRAEVVIRECDGVRDGACYIIDDGRKHCTISRKVGASPDGCVYFLVARIDALSYERLVDDTSRADGLFADADELCLCAVFEAEEAVSNVSVVEEYATIEEVPPEYLPPSPFVEFIETPSGYGEGE
jgi:hypothetical protein